MNNKIAIIGCGDVGSRIASRLLTSGTQEKNILPLVRTSASQAQLLPQFSQACMIDFDTVDNASNDSLQQVSELYYLVPPQKSGKTDQRSAQCIAALKQQKAPLERIVLISTTGVYGDCQGEHVTEETALNPTTPRSQRRADMEQQWQTFAEQQGVLLSILRVPGIYSHSRLPRARLKAQAPIVDPAECGYTNRIHADDLAMICEVVMAQQTQSDIYNATDGRPGKMSQYFLDVAEYLGLPSPKVSSFAEAERLVTSEMMSYLRESRKISNAKLLNTFNLQLRYEDYREGIRF